MADQQPQQQPTLRHLYNTLVSLETNAYSKVVRAFRAQGPSISWEKLRILEELRTMLFISSERHQAELLNAESDPLLVKIASSCNDSVFDRNSYYAETSVSSDSLVHTNSTLVNYGSDTDSDEFVADPAQNAQAQIQKPPKRKPGRKPKSLLMQQQNSNNFSTGSSNTMNTVNNISTGSVVKSLRGRPKQNRNSTGAVAPPVESDQYAAASGVLSGGEEAPTSPEPYNNSLLASPTPRKRGRPKGSGRKAPAPKVQKKAGAALHASAVQNDGHDASGAEMQQDDTDAAEVDEELALLESKDTPLERVEVIAESTNREIDELEKKLQDTTDEVEKAALVAEIKRKHEKLTKCITILETAVSEEGMDATAVVNDQAE